VRVCVCVCVCSYQEYGSHHNMGGWLELIGSLKLQVSFAEYHLFYRALLQKRSIILEPTNRSHPIVVSFIQFNTNESCPIWMKYVTYEWVMSHIKGLRCFSWQEHGSQHNTGWRRLIGSLKLQVIFRKRATKYRSLKLVVIFRKEPQNMGVSKYSVAKTHRIPYLYRSFSAKVTYI